MANWGIHDILIGIGIGSTGFGFLLLLKTLNQTLRKNFDRRKAIQIKEAHIDNQFYDSEKVSWWDQNGIMSGLHAMNATRVDYFTEILTKYHDSDKNPLYIDVGCGGGLVTEEMSKKGFKVIGFDMSEPSITQASKHAKEEGLDIIYKLGDAYNLRSEIEDASVDGIIMSDILEHLHDLPKVATEISRMLKPGGVFVFDTINRTVLSYLLAIVLVQEAPIGIVPAHTHNWSLFVKPEELEDVLHKVGLQVKEIRGLEVKKNFNLIKAALSRQIHRVDYHIGNDPSVQYIGYAVKL